MVDAEKLPDEVQVSTEGSASWQSFRTLPDSVFSDEVTGMARNRHAQQRASSSKGCLILLALGGLAAVIFAIFGMSLPDNPKGRVPYEAEQLLQQGLRDPSSYERVDWRVYEETEHLVVVIDYRAKNGFGGYSAGSAAFEFDKSGKFIRQR